MLRSAQIWRTAARYRLIGELWGLARGRPPKARDFAVRLAKAMEELGPGFIKIGQMLATRADLIGVRAATALAVLHDDLKGFEFAEVERIWLADVGKPIGSCFRAFDKRPVAAASVAQVHFALGKNGEKLAVKVLRPGVERLFVEDFRLFRRLSAFLGRISPHVRRLALPRLLLRLEKIIRAEMDLTLEAAHGDQLRDNLSELPGVILPKIHWSLSGKRVLTMDRMEGERIDSPRVLKMPVARRRKLIETAASMFFRQVFVDGFFHADLHPGNILVRGDGSLSLVDFGIMERLDASTRRTMAKIFLAFLRRDYQVMANEHIEAGYVKAPDGELNQFDLSLACRAIGESVRSKSIGEISMARVLGQLLNLAAKFGAEGQPQLLMLQKNILLTEAITRALAPQTDVWRLLRPHLEREEKRRLKSLKEGLAPLLAATPKAISGGLSLLGGIGSGIRLHPRTLEQLKDKRVGGGWWLTAGMALGAFLALLFAA